MYCSKCGRELPPGVSVCPVCSQTDTQAVSQPVHREIKRYNYLQANQNYRIIGSIIGIIVILWIRSDLYDILDDLDLYMSHSEITTIRTVFLVAVIALIAIEVSTYFATKSVYLELTPDCIQGNGLKSLAFPSTQPFKISYSELSETRFMFNPNSGVLQIPLHGGWISFPIENSAEARKLIEERRAAAGTP